MSVDKLVDSTQLDADLTSVANAIRTKGGTSSSLAFPADFVSAIAAIPSGGGTPNEDLVKWADGTISVVDLSGATSVKEGRFGYVKTGTSFSVSAPDVITVDQYAFRQSTKLTSIYLPKATYIGSYAFEQCAITSIFFPALTSNGDHTFLGCGSLITAVFPGFTGILKNTTFQNCTALKSVDLFQPSDLYSECFRGCTVFDTLIIRKTGSISRLNNINSFNGTPFASGGTGGTIYIPKALYDHLGDGTSLDYKAATNWSTINGYGTITWAKIEGSIYETQYADGTPIT